MVSNVKDIFDEFNPDLVGILPLKNPHFVAQLTRQHLFSGSLKEQVMGAASRADAASKFLFGAIERPLNIGNQDPFDRLLEVMETFNDLTLNKLAKDIKQKLGVNEIVRANSDGQESSMKHSSQVESQTKDQSKEKVWSKTYSSRTDTPGNKIYVYSGTSLF